MRSCAHGQGYTLFMVILATLSLGTVSFAWEIISSEPVSQFAGEVSGENYEEAEPPLISPVFRWDFSRAEVVHTYAYEQEVRSRFASSMDEDSGDMDQEVSARGLLLIKSQGDNTAELVMKDMKATTKIVVPHEVPKTMEQALPPFVLQGMKEDGSGSFGDSSQEMLLKMLFPLPAETLRIGDAVEVPAQLPFNVMGSLLHVKGRSRIQLTRYVNIGGRVCAQLDVDTEISDLKVPSELDGKFECATKGKAVFFFDVADRKFVAGTIALIMQASADAPMMQIEISGENTPDLPERMNLSMISDNLIRVRLAD